MGRGIGRKEDTRNLLAGDLEGSKRADATYYFVRRPRNHQSVEMGCKKYLDWPKGILMRALAHHVSFAPRM